MFQAPKGTSNDITIPTFSILLPDFDRVLALENATATITVEGIFSFYLI